MKYEIIFSKGEGEILTEDWLIYHDTRHSKTGFRADRYLLDYATFETNWDKHHMFYPTLDEAYAAFRSGDLEKGRGSF